MLYRLFELIPEELKVKMGVNEDELIKINEVYIDSSYPSEAGLLPSGLPSREQANIIYEKSKKIFEKVLLILESLK